MNLDKARAVFGKVVLLKYHARIFYLSIIIFANIGLLSLLALMFGRIFLFIVIIVFSLPSRLLRVLRCSGLNHVYLLGLGRGQIQIGCGRRRVGITIYGQLTKRPSQLDNYCGRDITNHAISVGSRCWTRGVIRWSRSMSNEVI
jgi:hypothetical protein